MIEEDVEGLVESRKGLSPRNRPCRFRSGTILEPREHIMPTLTIKGMPDALYRRLKERAVAHRRSLNSEILMALEQTVAAPPPDTRALLQRADALRGRLAVPRLTEARLRAAKAVGRP